MVEQALQLQWRVRIRPQQPPPAQRVPRRPPTDPRSIGRKVRRQWVAAPPPSPRRLCPPTTLRRRTFPMLMRQRPPTTSTTRPTSHPSTIIISPRATTLHRRHLLPPTRTTPRRWDRTVRRNPPTRPSTTPTRLHRHRPELPLLQPELLQERQRPPVATTILPIRASPALASGSKLEEEQIMHRRPCT